MMHLSSDGTFEQYAAEARQKWGSTAAYREYEEKTGNRSDRMQTDAAAGLSRIFAAFSALMRNGETPDSAEVQALVQALRDYISENYYCCTNEILAMLGQMYVADARFRQNLDGHAEGTAAFVRKAIENYCGR